MARSSSETSSPPEAPDPGSGMRDITKISVAYSGGPLRLTRDQIEPAGSMAARAFHDDPGSTYLFPDQGRRERFLLRLMTGVVRYGDLFGEVYTTPGEPEGIAV